MASGLVPKTTNIRRNLSSPAGRAGANPNRFAG
jgi:hypothetical protein